MSTCSFFGGSSPNTVYLKKQTRITSGATRFSGASRARTGKPDIFLLTPRGLVLPRDFTLGFAAISASTLSNQIWRCSGGKARLRGQSSLEHVDRVDE